VLTSLYQKSNFQLSSTRMRTGQTFTSTCSALAHRGARPTAQQATCSNGRMSASLFRSAGHPSTRGAQGARMVPRPDLPELQSRAQQQRVSLRAAKSR